MKFATINDAIDFYTKLAAENPENSVILNTLGDLYVKAGDRAKALNYYRQAMEILEKNTNYQNAIAIGKKILRYVGKNPETLVKIAKLYTKIGDYREAIRYVLLIEPEEVDLDHAEEVTGLIEFLISTIDNPEVKLKLSRISDAIKERLQATPEPAEEFDLLGFAESAEDMPPLLEEATIKIGEDAIIDLSVPQETVERPTKKVEPEFLEGVLKNLSEDVYQTSDNYNEQIKVLMDAGFYKEALWLLHNLPQDLRKNLPFDEMLLRCLVETNRVDEIKAMINDLSSGESAESIYYTARAYELIKENEKALTFYYKLRSLYGDFKDVNERIQKLRSGIK